MFKSPSQFARCGDELSGLCQGKKKKKKKQKKMRIATCISLAARASLSDSISSKLTTTREANVPRRFAGHLGTSRHQRQSRTIDQATDAYIRALYFFRRAANHARRCKSHKSLGIMFQTHGRYRPASLLPGRLKVLRELWRSRPTVWAQAEERLAGALHAPTRSEAPSFCDYAQTIARGLKSDSVDNALLTPRRLQVLQGDLRGRSASYHQAQKHSLAIRRGFPLNTSAISPRGCR